MSIVSYDYDPHASNGCNITKSHLPTSFTSSSLYFNHSDDIPIGKIKKITCTEDGCMFTAELIGDTLHFTDDRPRKNGNLEITKVIFNPPATIVFWGDRTKTVVKSSNEVYDPEKGLAMAIAKKAMGNTGSYYEMFKKWLTTTKTCDTCLHSEKCYWEEPCCSCDDYFTNWEEIE